MEKFQTQSSLDNKILKGICWSPLKPRAVISLIHGFGEHCARYAPLGEFLQQHNIALITLDLRGHGQSEGKRGIINQYEDFYFDIEDLIAEAKTRFKNIDHFIMGHSMGGTLAINYQLNHKRNDIKAYIITSPLFRLTHQPTELLRPIMKLLQWFAPNLTFEKTLDSSIISTLPDEAKAYETDPLNHGKVGAVLGLDMIDYGKYALSQSNKWNWPMFLAHSRHDQLTDYAASEEFAKGSKTVKFIAYEKAGHELQNDFTQNNLFTEILNFTSNYMDYI